MANRAVQDATGQGQRDRVGSKVEQLVRDALAERDQHRRWRLVHYLQKQASRQVLDAALTLCRATSARERVLGADILAQISGEGHYSWEPGSLFYEERLRALLALLNDRRATVLDHAAVGLGHMTDVRAVDPLIALKDHPSRRVRHAVVFGLLGLEDDRAIRTLVELSQDVGDDVRDWATFGLGTQIEADTPEIREALAQRIYDADLETRGEAIVGLARRKDARAVGPLLDDLISGDVGILSLEAAEALADPRLLPALLGLKERWTSDGRGWEDWWERTLAEAIAACGGAAAPT